MEKNTVPTFKIKPAKAGLLVKDPETREPLKAAGENKPRNAYWLRRIQDGDCLEIKSTATSKTVAQNKETK